MAESNFPASLFNNLIRNQLDTSTVIEPLTILSFNILAPCYNGVTRDAIEDQLTKIDDN